MDGIKEMMHLAKTSSCENTLSELSESKNMLVRRATARNINTPVIVLGKLADDMALNVSYMATLNPNCTVNRGFREEDITMCVTCEKDEVNMDCHNCSF